VRIEEGVKKEGCQRRNSPDEKRLFTCFSIAPRYLTVNIFRPVYGLMMRTMFVLQNKHCSVVSPSRAVKAQWPELTRHNLTSITVAGAVLELHRNAHQFPV